jgi:hypothetical protein
MRHILLVIVFLLIVILSAGIVYSQEEDSNHNVLTIPVLCVPSFELYNALTSPPVEEKMLFNSRGTMKIAGKNNSVTFIDEVQGIYTTWVNQSTGTVTSSFTDTETKTSCIISIMTDFEPYIGNE